MADGTVAPPEISIPAPRTRPYFGPAFIALLALLLGNFALSTWAAHRIAVAHEAATEAQETLGTLWRLGTREAAVVRPRPPPPMLGGAEHVRALAGLYERADLGRHALDVTSRRFRRAVEGRAGIPWELDRLDLWLKDELGPEAALDFARVRAAFGRLYSVEEPETDAVLATARLAARFEARWLGPRGSSGGDV